MNTEDLDKYARRRWLYLTAGVMSLVLAAASSSLELGTLTMMIWVLGAAFWFSCYHLAGRISRGEWDVNT